VDALGPVDWIWSSFPGARFDGSIVPILVDLEERGIIRVLDLVVLKKDAGGAMEAFELSDLAAAEIGGPPLSTIASRLSERGDQPGVSARGHSSRSSATCRVSRREPAALRR
jgi:hypothetical protein